MSGKFQFPKESSYHSFKQNKPLKWLSMPTGHLPSPDLVYLFHARCSFCWFFFSSYWFISKHVNSHDLSVLKCGCKPCKPDIFPGYRRTMPAPIRIVQKVFLLLLVFGSEVWASSGLGCICMWNPDLIPCHF
jgi:hypothetical protein